MAKTLTPEQYARRAAENDPCHASNAYGDPCCAECAAELTVRSGYAGPHPDERHCTHDNECDWVLLRAYYKLPVPVTLHGTRHTTPEHDG